MLPSFRDWFAGLDKMSIKALTKFPSFDVLEMRLSKGNLWVMLDTKDFRVFLKGNSKQGKQLQAFFGDLPKQTRRLEIKVLVDKASFKVQTKADEMVWYWQDPDYDYVCHLGASKGTEDDADDDVLEL